MWTRKLEDEVQLLQPSQKNLRMLTPRGWWDGSVLKVVRRLAALLKDQVRFHEVAYNQL